MVTTCLTSKLTEETTAEYSDWEACASLYVTVDVLTHHDGIRHSGLVGHTSLKARRLLVLIACMFQQPRHNPPHGHPMGMGALADLAASFSFNDIRNRTTQSHFCVDL